ncbi:hypothetical protein Z949_3181 [Sulfitobacter guttiformis KCTC 32187]|nr:hypothetical protein Z949_3181 [Sulfitobacter guttiformis KCTC 32187]
MSQVNLRHCGGIREHLLFNQLVDLLLVPPSPRLRGAL